jgi:hypothetical protein
VSVCSYIRKLLEKSSSAPTNTCCGDEVSEESNEEVYMENGTYPTSRLASALKNVMFHISKFSVFQCGGVSKIVEWPPAGHDSFYKAVELTQDPSGRVYCVRCGGHISGL